jgi:hypothetical protein
MGACASGQIIRDRDRGNDYGDWLSIGTDTPKELIGTAYFAYSTHLLARSIRPSDATKRRANTSNCSGHQTFQQALRFG